MPFRETKRYITDDFITNFLAIGESEFVVVKWIHLDFVRHETTSILAIRLNEPGATSLLALLVHPIWHLTYLALRLCFLFLLPGPAPLWRHVLRNSRQYYGRDPETDNQGDPICITEQQRKLSPQWDELCNKRVESDAPPVLAQECHT